jgi:hypothetical protein
LAPDEQQTLECISDAGGGQLLGAANATELSDAIFSVLEEEVPDIVRPTPAPRVTQAATGPTGSRENPIPLGSAADIGGEWFVSVIDVTPDATDLVLTENQFNDPPAEGNQFFIARISATYEGEGSSTLAADLAFFLVGKLAVSYSTFENTCGVYPDSFSITEVFPGGTIERNLCWSVPSAEVDSLVMYSKDVVTFDQNKRVYFALR